MQKQNSNNLPKLIIIITIILLIGTLFGVVFYLAKQVEVLDVIKQVNQDQLIGKIEGSDWKNFNDARLDFTFKYPDDWEIYSKTYYFDETKTGTVVLQKKDNKSSIERVTINIRQNKCIDGNCDIIIFSKCDDKRNKNCTEKEDHTIVTNSSKSEILDVFNKIVDSIETVKVKNNREFDFYRNEKYGFEFEVLGRIYSFTEKYYFTKNQPPSFEIVLKDGANISLRTTCADEMLFNNLSNNENYIHEVANNYRLIRYNKGVGQFGYPGYNNSVKFLGDEYSYYITHYDRWGSIESIERNDAFFQNIISTFKIFPITEPIHWETYINNKYNFEIKYPVNSYCDEFNISSFDKKNNNPEVASNIIFSSDYYDWESFKIMIKNNTNLSSEETRDNAIQFSKKFTDSKEITRIVDFCLNGKEAYSFDIEKRTLSDIFGNRGIINKTRIVYLKKGTNIFMIQLSLRKPNFDNEMNQIISTFKFIEDKETFSCGNSTVKDIDGNIYNTVKIGDQCWMKENLKVTKNSAGKLIMRYCLNDNASSCDNDGGLYNWNTAMDGSTKEGAQGICPNGWHIPKDLEWFVLENYLKDEEQTCSQNRVGWGCDSVGTKIRIKGSSGFEAPFTGYRDIDKYGTIHSWGSYVGFWSSSACRNETWYRFIRSDESRILRVAINREYGHAIRCLRN